MTYRGLHYDRARPSGLVVRHRSQRCLDLLQQRRSRPQSVAVEQAQEVAARDALAAEPLLDALATLTPRLREILQLRYFGGCSYREMAEALTIPTGTVMSRLHAARLALAAAYNED